MTDYWGTDPLQSLGDAIDAYADRTYDQARKDAAARLAADFDQVDDDDSWQLYRAMYGPKERHEAMLIWGVRSERAKRYRALLGQTPLGFLPNDEEW